MSQDLVDWAQPLAAFESTVRGRRSVRRYQSRPVPRADLLAVLDAARWAPSPHNTMPWRFSLLTRETRKRTLAEAMARRWRSDLTQDGLAQGAIEAQVHRSWQRLTTAPALVVICAWYDDLDSYPDPTRQGAERLMAAHSLGAAAQTLLLAAHARGLAACWMCAPLFCPEVVAQALGLPPGAEPQALVTLGYAASDPGPREKRSLESLLLLDD